ncbi:uncharacterized protein LOC143770341 isoform X2 [Ranitomeya variabilis]|uniref:uncharacterized protein LOC143770341 isoform X2 n=1 Tax=Ranitomeya variabilis TaxID=490064 RepID=UPI004056F657
MVMVSQGQCFLLCSTLMLMVSGFVHRKEVSCGESVYFNPPVSLEKSQSVVWSFRKELFINQACADASKDNGKVQSQWELFSNGSLKLTDVTHSDQGHYRASIKKRNFSAIVMYEVYLRSAGSLLAELNNDGPATPAEKMNTFVPGAVIGIALGIINGVIITVVIIIFVLKKAKGKIPKNPEYESENLPSPHIYVNESVSFEMERTESINSNRHYESLTHPDGAVYNQLNNAPAANFFQHGNRPQETFSNIRLQA